MRSASRWFCKFYCSKAVIVGLIFNTRQETISVSHIVMFAEKTYNAFEPVGHTKTQKREGIMRKLFLLEDDLSLISGLTFAFKKQGFALDTARTLAEAEVLWSDRKYDLLVLDVSLPDGSGFDFCQKVRRTSNVPILFLTASDEEMNIIMGLELGGDDYLTKPFKLGVLLSRVNALLRRANASSAGEPVLESGSITVRLLQGQAYKNGILLELTGAEYKLLCFFMQHPNAVLSKEQILDALWDCDGDYIDSSALTVYIRRLRMKIEDDPGKPQMLLTVRGMGYKWNG